MSVLLMVSWLLTSLDGVLGSSLGSEISDELPSGYESISCGLGGGWGCGHCWAYVASGVIEVTETVENRLFECGRYLEPGLGPFGGRCRVDFVWEGCRFKG
jgi:hypothetical protein